MTRKLGFLAAAISALLSGGAFAFHDGGVAYCEGCHTMHNSSKNAAINTHSPVGVGVQYLLKNSDQSSTCIQCHSGATLSSYHIFTNPVPNWAGGAAPVNLTPGGDFAWISSPIRTAPTGSHSTPPAPQRLGHNVIAADFVNGAFGVVDPDIAQAPGGTYLSTNLTCVSCHDPHSANRMVDGTGNVVTSDVGSKVLPIGGSGSYDNSAFEQNAGGTVNFAALGVYRLLGGIGYKPASYAAAPAFTAQSPNAVAPATYNRTEAVSQTHVAYGKGMSEWCANCHTNIHTAVSDGQNAPFIHPAGSTALLNQSANLHGKTYTNAIIYASYLSSGDLSGDGTKAYLSLVPYEEGTSDLATLQGRADNTDAKGTSLKFLASGTENVQCLSCHRAHASGFGSMTRWAATGDEFITIAGQWPGKDRTDGAEGIAYSDNWTQAQYSAAMYNQPASKFAYAQRSLCNKCHAKD